RDAVVIAWEALRLHQPLPAARRAAIPVGPVRPLSVIGGDDRLRLHGHLVDGPVPKIDQPLGMADGETGGSALMPGVGGGGGVMVLERGGQRPVGDTSRPTAVAHALELAIPVCGRHPDFEFYDGIRTRACRGGDAAEAG